MAWVWLGIAGAMEMVWAIGLKYVEGFTRPLASAVTIAAMILFGEPRDAARVGCILLIVAGVAGLKWLSPH